MERLGEAIATAQHGFWTDDASLLHSRIADRTRIHGPRQVTDLYLLALAVRRGAAEEGRARAAIAKAEPRISRMARMRVSSVPSVKSVVLFSFGEDGT